MVYTSALLSLGLAASSVVAAGHSKSGFTKTTRGRVAKRSNRQGRVIERVGFSQEDSTSESSNWSGAVLESYSAEWRAVYGTFTVPTPKAPSGGSSSTTYSASAWVGIDGDSCQTALFQTGVDFNIKGGKVSYDSWHEWIPAAAVSFTGISFAAGDKVTLSVTAASKTEGTAIIENTTKNQKVSKVMTGTKPLCFQDAEWIVEDFEEGGSLVPLVNWGTVTFTNATAVTSTGAVQGVANADIINLINSKKQVITSTKLGAETVAVTYTGA